MKISKFFLLVAAISLVACKNDSIENNISYKISSILLEEKPMLKVNITCKTEPNGKTSFLFLNDAWGEKDLHNTIHSIKALHRDSNIEILKDSGWIVINHPKDLKTLKFEYIIKQDSEDMLTTRTIYRPVIQPEYFHLFSHSLLMIPLEYSKEENDTFDVTIAWENFPEDYTIQNSFGSNERFQDLKNITDRELSQSVFIGGDYRTHTLNIHNNKVAYTTRGHWETFNDSTILKILEKTITAQRNFWKDHSQNYFSVNLTPTDEKKGSSFQGTGLTNSFDCSATNNEYLEVEGLVYLFNHELLHNWIGHIIKNDNEEQQYWFSEGFTDYYTYKNIAKFSINNLDEGFFIDKFNENIKSLFNSPVKEAPNSDINYKNFWENRDYGKLPYYRGALFAFYLDQKIKQDSKGKQSLDDLMLAIKNDASKSEQKISHPYFINKANEFLKDDISPFFKAHIEKGKLFNMESMLKNFGFEYDTKSTIFDLGFTFSQDRNSILAIDDSSEAYKAGLRANDQIISRDYYNGSIEYKAEFIVLRNKKEIEITYYPKREASIITMKNNSYNKKQLNL